MKAKQTTFYVPGLDGVWKNKLEHNRRPGGSSKPLSPSLLKEKKHLLADQHYNWLFISTWFGLRPEEITRKLWTIVTHPEYTYVLTVFQDKLFKRGVAKDDSGKHIPCLFPEQIDAIRIIQQCEFIAPSPSVMRRVFGKGFSLYSGRNNFSGMLRDNGYDLETRKHYMGHLSIKTTESYDRKTMKNRVFQPNKKIS